MSEDQSSRERPAATWFCVCGDDSTEGYHILDMPTIPNKSALREIGLQHHTYVFNGFYY